MAIHGKFWNGYLLVNAVDLSDHVKSMTLTIGKEVLDLTCMSNAGKVRGVGIEDHSINVTFVEDLTAAKVYATLKAIWAAGTPVTINFKLDSGADSAVNPNFTSTYILDRYPIGGQHGQLLQTQVTFLSCSVMVFDVA